MTDKVVFPQHGDEPDAAFFAGMLGDISSTGFIVSGLDFTNYSPTDPSVDITRGNAFIHRESMETASSDISPNKTVDDVLHKVQFEGSTVSLTDDQINELYLDGQISTEDDEPQILVDPSSVTDSMLKIGEIDTTDDTLSPQWYLVAGRGVLSFPDESAADAASTNLREATIVYERASNTHYYVE